LYFEYGEMMEIVVDGIVFESNIQGGISRIYTEILPRMCELSNDIEFILLTAGKLKQPLPFHTRIHHLARPGIQHLLPGRWFANLKNDARGIILKNIPVNDSQKAIWHSTYFTLPYQWQGLNLFVLVIFLSLQSVLDILFSPFGSYYAIDMGNAIDNF